VFPFVLRDSALTLSASVGPEEEVALGAEGVEEAGPEVEVDLAFVFE